MMKSAVSGWRRGGGKGESIMAVAEDIRNLYKEFGGHVESYVEFDHVARMTAAQTAGTKPAPNDARAPDSLAGKGNEDSQALGEVFARLAGRTLDQP